MASAQLKPMKPLTRKFTRKSNSYRLEDRELLTLKDGLSQQQSFPFCLKYEILRNLKRSKRPSVAYHFRNNSYPELIDFCNTTVGGYEQSPKPKYWSLSKARSHQQVKPYHNLKTIFNDTRRQPRHLTYRQWKQPQDSSALQNIAVVSPVTLTSRAQPQHPNRPRIKRSEGSRRSYSKKTGRLIYQLPKLQNQLSGWDTVQ